MLSVHDLREEEKMIQQDRDEDGSRMKLLDLTVKPEIKPQKTTVFTEHHVSDSGFSPDPQLWNQESNSGLEPEEPQQIKEEQEELCIGQEGELVVVKLEADTLEENEHKPNSEQLLSHNSAVTEVKIEEGSQHEDSRATEEKEEPKPKKRRHSNSDEDSPTSMTERGHISLSKAEQLLNTIAGDVSEVEDVSGSDADDPVVEEVYIPHDSSPESDEQSGDNSDGETQLRPCASKRVQRSIFHMPVAQAYLAKSDTDAQHVDEENMLHSNITVRRRNFSLSSSSVTRRRTLMWTRNKKMLHMLKRKNYIPIKK
ncbi:uncharacterized protein KZ484_011030 [Pholidichthys leucotaenia]